LTFLCPNLNYDCFFHQTDTSSVIESAHLSALTTNSSKYSSSGCDASNYYYEAIRVNVAMSGYYRLRSSTTVNTVGYIYKETFNTINFRENLLSENDDSCGGVQFKFILNLQVGTTYIVVVTTYLPYNTGTFSILASGPSTVSLNRISEYMYHLVNNRQRSKEYRKSL
jgi:hypothetical protein